MALIQCPECRRSVSDSAMSCPHCGFALADPTKRSGCLPVILIILVPAIALLVWALGKNWSPQDEARWKAEEAIDSCWKEHERKSLSPEAKRLMALSCERLENGYRERYGSNP